MKHPEKPDAVGKKSFLKNLKFLLTKVIWRANIVIVSSTGNNKN